MAKKSPPPKPADWQPEQTLRALQKQLQELEKLKGRNFHEARHDEQQWENLTLNVLIHGFGEDGEPVGQFHHARWAGTHYMGGMSQSLLQSNFNERMAAYSSMLKSTTDLLEMMVPEQEIKGVYEPGDEYDFYRDLNAILATATKEIFIIDNYLDTDLFDLYAAKLSPSIQVRVITDQLRGNLLTVAQKFALRNPFELRTSKDVHDRVIFVDDKCWVIGQSIKDAARKKPTYIVEVSSAAMKQVYELIWAAGTPIVKS